MTNNAQRATYTYDSAGRLISLTNFNGAVTTYGYDNANRLTSLENKKSDLSVIATYQFTLDGNGNRTQGVQSEPLVPVIPVGTTTYTYNTQKNRLLSAGPVNFGYDNEGQLSSGYGSSYTFDYEHRLIGIGSSYQFLYEGSGNRLQAVRSGVVTRYIYGGGGNLLAEADGQNNITRYYIYGLGLLAMVTPSDQVYCYHFNAIGSTIAMTDQTQAMVNKYAHEPFGNIANRVEAVTQPFKFVGQLGVMTEPNGFYYMRARYYDPEVGRFISEDPIGFEGGDVNLMAYVSNNPVNETDPLGLLGPFGPGFKNVRWPSPNPYLPGPDTEMEAPYWMQSMSYPRGKAIPGQWGAAAAFPAVTVGPPLAILGTGAIYGGVAAGPAISTFVLTHPEVPILFTEFLQGYLPTGPPSTRAGNFGFLARTVQDFGVSVYQNYFSPKP